MAAENLIETKALPFEGIGFDEVDGIVEGIAAVTGNWDRVNECIEAGAFARTIAERKSKIPMGYDHEHAFGLTLDMAEVGRSDLPQRVRSAAPDATGGLWAKGQVVLSDENIRRLDRTRQLAQAGRPPGMSITYRVIRDQKGRAPNGRNGRVLQELALNEWGVQDRLRPVNTAAMVIEAKGVLVGTGDTELKALVGSDEAKRETIMGAIRAAGLFATGTGGWSFIVGTFADYVVVCVSAADSAGERHYRVEYSISPEGEVTLGTVSEVEMQMTVAEKAVGLAQNLAIVEHLSAELKAGRVLSAANLTALDDAITALKRIRAAATGAEDGAGDSAEDEDDSSKSKAATTTPPVAGAPRWDARLRMSQAEMDSLVTHARALGAAA